MTLQAIPTRYAGCLFRSRLEARWAVFFDALKIEWRYEPEGFRLGWCACCPRAYESRGHHCPDDALCDDDHEWADTHDSDCERTMYLPDFFLPASKTWVEVKASDDSLDKDLLLECVDWGIGLPHCKDSYGTTRGLLILGDIPRPDKDLIQGHSIIQHRKGGIINMAWFDPALTVDSSMVFYDHFDGSYRGPICNPGTIFYPVRPPREVPAAYAAARSARFEHGDREAW